MISKTFTHLSLPGEIAPLFPAFASPYSHQFDTHWGNQQTTIIPAAREAFQYNDCWAGQQTTTTIAAQKATLGQNQLERIKPSITASTLYHQLADNQSLDILRATNLHTRLRYHQKVLVPIVNLQIRFRYPSILTLSINGLLTHLCQTRNCHTVTYELG